MNKFPLIVLHDSILGVVCFQMVKQLHLTMSELVNEHKRTYDDDTMRNLTDVYLKQIKESNDPNFNGMYSTPQLIPYL